MSAAGSDQQRSDDESDAVLLERRVFHAELMRYELTRGYRFGWTRRTFLDRFGASPPLEWSEDAPASHIRPDTFKWLRKRAAAYALACEAKKK